eukprot:5729049-Alexandrium_andersonii.AAC.1
MQQRFCEWQWGDSGRPGWGLAVHGLQLLRGRSGWPCASRLFGRPLSSAGSCSGLLKAALVNDGRS